MFSALGKKPPFIQLCKLEIWGHSGLILFPHLTCQITFSSQNICLNHTLLSSTFSILIPSSLISCLDYCNHPLPRLGLPVSQTWLTCTCCCSLPTSSPYCNEVDLLKNLICSLPPPLWPQQVNSCTNTLQLFSSILMKNYKNSSPGLRGLTVRPYLLLQPHYRPSPFTSFSLIFFQLLVFTMPTPTNGPLNMLFPLLAMFFLIFFTQLKVMMVSSTITYLSVCSQTSVTTSLLIHTFRAPHISPS